MSKRFPVRGLADLDKFLSALPGNLQKNAIRAGLTAAARVVREEARSRAPKETGLLAASIKSGSPRQNADGTFSIRVALYGPKDGGNHHAFLGIFHEYGVAPHLIARTKGGAGRVALRKARPSGDNREILAGPLKIGDTFVSGIVVHPGRAAHPFMRPSLDAKAEEATQAFASRIRAYIEGKTGFAVPADEAA